MPAASAFISPLAVSVRAVLKPQAPEDAQSSAQACGSSSTRGCLQADTGTKLQAVCTDHPSCALQSSKTTGTDVLIAFHQFVDSSGFCFYFLFINIKNCFSLTIKNGKSLTHPG